MKIGSQIRMTSCLCVRKNRKSAEIKAVEANFEEKIQRNNAEVEVTNEVNDKHHAA